MGNTQPTNKTGKSATTQKLENAKRLGILSLTGHSLEKIPKQIYEEDSLASKLRTLDLSDNKLSSLTSRLSVLSDIKILNLERNKLAAGSMGVVSKFSKLQKLQLSTNKLGHLPAQSGPKASSKVQSAPAGAILPPLPSSLKELILASNQLLSIPSSIFESTLARLEKLDLSGNHLAAVDGIGVLVGLVELNLDNNYITSLPTEMEKLLKLKALSLRHNKITVKSTMFTSSNPQPIPKGLFVNTLVVDLNLEGNAMTNTQLNEFEGFHEFLDRRQKVKNKTLQNLSVCGLK